MDINKSVYYIDAGDSYQCICGKPYCYIKKTFDWHQVFSKLCKRDLNVYPFISVNEISKYDFDGGQDIYHNGEIMEPENAGDIIYTFQNMIRKQDKEKKEYMYEALRKNDAIYFNKMPTDILLLILDYV